MKLLVDANSDGGALLGIMPEAACAQQCLDRYPECVAVDYRTSDQNCYWHDVGTGVQWNDCCNRYQISCERTSCRCAAVFDFYRRDAMLARVLAVTMCPSVCLSQVGVLSKWTDGSSWFLARRLLSTSPTLCWKEFQVSIK